MNLKERWHSVLQGQFLSSLAGPGDTNYNFQWANMGVYRSSFDCGIFNRLSLSQSSTKKPRLCLHQHPSHGPCDDRDISYFIIGDNAFPLKMYLISPMQTCPQENIQLPMNALRARRVVENAFGNLVNRFNCLHIVLAPSQTLQTSWRLV